MDELTIIYNEFVNRGTELKRFCRILDENEYAVMVISGETGMGKTALHKRLMYECREARKMRWAETYAVNTRTYNYLYILRKLRDDIGEIHFQRFTDLLNYFTNKNYEFKLSVPAAGSINILNEAHLENSTIEQVIGQQIVIHDLHIDEPRDDKAFREEERMYKLTQQFIADLTAALNGEPLVIFIDDIEQETMPPETMKWMWTEFVKGIMDKGLQHIRFVFSISTEPQVPDALLERKVRAQKLALLTEEYVFEYLNKRNVGEDYRKGLGEMIMAMGQGKPSQMADMVKLFLNRMRDKEDT